MKYQLDNLNGSYVLKKPDGEGNYHIQGRFYSDLRRVKNRLEMLSPKDEVDFTLIQDKNDENLDKILKAYDKRKIISARRENKLTVK